MGEVVGLPGGSKSHGICQRLDCIYRAENDMKVPMMPGKLPAIPYSNDAIYKAMKRHHINMNDLITFMLVA